MSYLTSRVGLVLGLLILSVAHADERVRIIKSFDDSRYAISHVAINDNGDVAFTNSFKDLWFVPANGTARNVVGPDVEVPGIDKSSSYRINSFAINDLGQLAISISVRERHGIWRYDPDGGIALACVDGMDIPNMPGKTFGRPGLRGFSDGANSKVLFQSDPSDNRQQQQQPRDLFDVPGDDSFWLWQQVPDGSITQIGDGPLGGHTRAYANKLGDVALVDSRDRSPVRIVSNGIMIPVHGEGDPLQINGSGVEVRSRFSASLNRIKNLAFVAGNRNLRPIICWFDKSALSVVPTLYPGMPVEGYARETFDINARVILNDHDNILFYSSGHIESETSSPCIVFCEKGKQPVAIVKDGEKAPGTDAVFHSLSEAERAEIRESRDRRRFTYGNASVPFTDVSFNNRNQAAFSGLVRGNVDASIDIGVWLADCTNRTVTPVVRNGDVFPLNGKKIVNIQLTGIGIGNNVYNSLNSRGQLAYALFFEDGSSAVVVDDRFAIAEEPAASVAQITHIDAGRKKLTDWMKLADAQIEVNKKAQAETTHTKLTSLAKKLRTEFQEAKTELAELRKETSKIDAITRYERSRQLELRLRELPAIWNAVASWPYQKETTKTPDQYKHVAASASQLLDKFGEFEEIREAVEQKNKQLQDSLPKPLNFVHRDREGRMPRLLSYSSSSERITLFDDGIGQVPDDLFAKPEVAAREANVDVPDGPIVTLRERIGTLVKLRLGQNGMLNLDQAHWYSDRPKTSESEMYSTAYELLKEADIDEEALFDERMRKFGIWHFLGGIGDTTGALAAFNEFQQSASASFDGFTGMSSGGGGSSRSVSRRFRLKGIFASHLEMDGDSVELDFSELTDTHRSFFVRDLGDAQLRITIESKNRLFMFSQNANGSVRWIRDDGDSLVARTAHSFGELYKQYPDEVDNELIGFLNAHGVVGPAMRTDQAFMESVVRRLRGDSGDVTDTVTKLTAQLDSNKFEERNAAFVELANDASLYRPALEKQLETEVSFEVKERIERLVKFANDISGEYDNLVNVLGTCDSAEQLTTLRERAANEQKPLFDARLQSLGGE
ncbi:MAG: hypothetical protein KDB27_21390 [Planctomycetales bacterium]|nr:hypothetical protein [Planctomycetales bacterium]